MATSALYPTTEKTLVSIAETQSPAKVRWRLDGHTTRNQTPPCHHDNKGRQLLCAKRAAAAPDHPVGLLWQRVQPVQVPVGGSKSDRL